MAYEIIAVDPDTGETVAEMVTQIEHSGAHMLMGALGLDYDQDDDMGSGDSYMFTDAELSTAEEALMLADNALPAEEIRAGIAQAQVFLHDVREWMQKEADGHEYNDTFDIEVEIGFF